MNPRTSRGDERGRVRLKVTLGGVLGGLLAVTVAIVCFRLGFWQLDRLEQRRAFNATAAAALSLPPIEIDSSAIAAIEADPDAYVLRRGRIRGSAVSGAEVVLRGRSHAGGPGVHLVSSVRLPDAGRVVLVNRGWIPSPDAASLNPTPYLLEGEAVFEGVLQRVPESGAEAAPVDVQVEDTVVTTFRRLDRATLASASPEPLLPLYLEVSGEPTAAPPVPVPLPTFDEGSHLGYAFQWFSFGTIALLGYVILVILRVRRHAVPPSRD